MTEQTPLVIPNINNTEDEVRKHPSDATRLDSSNIIGTTNKSQFIRQIGNRNEEIKYSFLKAVVCGDFIEFHEAQLPFILGRVSPNKGNNLKRDDSIKKEYKRRNIKRTKDTIRRLVLGNFTNEVKLLTLTFRNTEEFDIKDISVCNKKFSIFMHLLRKLYEDFKYVAVLELQKREAVHYHVLCDLPFIDKEKIAVFWGLGFIDIRRTNVAYEALVYILKYFHKSIYDKRFRNKRIYFCSKNLTRPKNLYCEKAYNLRRKMAEENRNSTYTYSMDSPENGKIHVVEYNLRYTLPRSITPNDKHRS